MNLIGREIASYAANNASQRRGNGKIGAFARTIEMRENMLEKSKQRIEADAADQWTVDVLARVED